MTQEDKDRLEAEIEEIFLPYPEARAFIKAYQAYAHMIDDIIDEKFDRDLVMRAFSLANLIFSCDFYQRNKAGLGLVEQLICNTYADTAEWERSPEKWKRVDAKALSHCGQDMLYAVILIIAGRDALRKISLRFREYSHLEHINDPELHEAVSET